MSNVIGVFPGSQRESVRLQEAIRRNCMCPSESIDPICPAHDLLRDINVLAHLIFVYRRRQNYVRVEHSGKVR